MALFLLLVVLAIALGLTGAVAHGLLYLLFIGIAVLIAALVYGAARLRQTGRRPTR